MKQMLPKPRSPSCHQACILFSMQRNMILPASVVHESFISKMSFYPELINQVELEKGTDFPLSDLMEKIDPHAASRKEKYSEKAWAVLWVLGCVSQREVCSHTIGCVQGCSLLVPWYPWRVQGRGLALLLWIRYLLCCLTSPSEGWAWYEQFTFPIAKTAACMKLLNLPAITLKKHHTAKWAWPIPPARWLPKLCLFWFLFLFNTISCVSLNFRNPLKKFFFMCWLC